ncbi:MAG: mannose-phosphate guanylyltransferase/mannose-6-phosphate isomerase [Panacagrimonas sp.]|nr:mannose-1-phosphate guanylyltransferase/mannose-6-phosphate isomerase [Panacagrimonas sp.]MCC2656836.1 mannose-phosphate guanylyltransferase/mannose-6-phosphate isomerase [Panacagrimonas sp.]
MSVVVPVLMAGGSGTRLWPLSRTAYPKQFLRLLADDCSLLQSTVRRAQRVPGATAPVVIGNEAHRFIIAEQLQEIGFEHPEIVLEPEGRNTAPVAAVAAHYALARHGADALVFLMAADQNVHDVAAFVSSATLAVEAARAGRLVTFGIQPQGPETGFGYVRVGAPLQTVPGAFEVSGFFEKPSLERAQGYLSQGGYYWNGGMFMFRADAFLRELQALEPDMHDHAGAALSGAAPRDLDFIRLDPGAFKACRSDSIDYAVMEKSRNIALVPLDAGWDDVGSWTFLAKLHAADEDGNHVRGNVILEDARNNLVQTGKRLVSLLGVENTVVIESDDAVLVASRDRLQDVGKIVKRLQGDRRGEANSLPRVARPWGYYETIAVSDRFQVKRILVKPKHKLSLQMHHHRAEHWVVVRGTAKVTCGDKEFLLTEDQSTYIPLGTTHRVENPGKVPLEMIEVQSGAYLGEDDIVRFEDVYGRTAK